MILILILCHMNHCEQHAYCLWCVFSDQHFRISKFIIKYMFYICTTFYVYNEHEYFKTGRHTHTYYTPSDPFNWLDVLVECNWNTREWHDSQPNNCLKSFSQRLHKHVRNHVQCTHFHFEYALYKYNVNTVNIYMNNWECLMFE